MGLSAGSESLYSMLKCKTSEKEKFHEAASNISREILVFVKSGFFSDSRKKSTLAKGPFSALVRHTDIVRYPFSLLFAIIHHSLAFNWCETTVKTIKIIKYYIFVLSTLAAAGNRTPKAEFLLKQAKMNHFIRFFC